MNVRIFLLIGMTAFFAVLWRSDQQYQTVQGEIARRARIEQQLATTSRNRCALSCSTRSHVDSARLNDKRSGARPVWKLDDGLSIGLQWVRSANSGLQERYCWIQWRVRQNLFFTGRRLSVAWRRQMALRDLAEALVRERLRPGSIPQHAAVGKSAETR